SDGKQSLVYKHAVSTITPARPINNFLNELRKEAEEA
ncbi:MAG: RNA chaperone Hfq, partial [Bacillota bacterium]